MAIKRPICVVLTRRSSPSDEEIALIEQYPQFEMKFRTARFVDGIEPNTTCYAGVVNADYDRAKIPRVEDYKAPEKSLSKTRRGAKPVADKKPEASTEPAANPNPKPPQAANLPGAPAAATWGGAGKS